MITIDDEFEVVQNDILGAHLLHEFCKSYSNSIEKKNPKLYLLFLVLPIIYSREIVDIIYQKRFRVGSFAKAVEENKSAFFDLQYRVEKMAKKTLNSLNIALASQILEYSKKDCALILNRQTKISYSYNTLNDEYQKKIMATKRLGAWFCALPDDEILIQLNIKY